jgi:hypothetical protein
MKAPIHCSVVYGMALVTNRSVSSDRGVLVGQEKKDPYWNDFGAVRNASLNLHDNGTFRLVVLPVLVYFETLPCGSFTRRSSNL